MTTRVRIAPSPTGNLHIGTARTALFNYLFAKHENGQFILRVEDTDLERSKEEYTKNIFDGLKGLGLTWDEGPDVGGDLGPYKQSERFAIYRDWAEKLLNDGKAYHCYHTKDELDAARKEASETGVVKPDTCRDEAGRNELASKPAEDGGARKPSLRFRIPDNRGAVVINDIIRGTITVEHDQLSDFVILKSDGTASYNFAVVVDDMLMQITHVVRGEDHISNTPRQILLYEAFGATVPQFAHVSLILAPDRSKLSKRHGATSVAEFIERGYLPEAFCQFLAHLGWSDPEDKTDEFQPLAEIAKRFTLDRISDHAAVFDIEKLNHLNGKYIREMDVSKLLECARPFLTQFDLSQYSDEKLQLMLDAVRKNLTTLAELPDAVIYFFGLNVILDAKLVGDVLTGDDPRTVLTKFQSDVIDKADWTSMDDLGAKVHDLADALKPTMKTRTVMWSIRAAVTGRTSGADLNKVLYLLGKNTVAHRVKTALQLTTGQAV